MKEYRSVVANELGCDIVVCEFELQSYYYVHYQTKIIWKGMNPLIIFTQPLRADRIWYKVNI